MNSNKRAFEIEPQSSIVQPNKKNTHAGHELCVALMKVRSELKDLEFKALSGAGSLERCKLYYQEINKIDEAVYMATKTILHQIGEERFYVHPPMDKITSSIDLDKCFDDLSDLTAFHTD